MKNRVRDFARLSGVEATLISIFCIAFAIQYNSGSRSRLALAFLTVALVSVSKDITSRSLRLRWSLPCAILGWEFLALWFAQPCLGLLAGAVPFRAGILFCGIAACIVCVARSDRSRQVAFAIAVGAMFVVGVWVLRTTPKPPIDTYIVQQDGSAALFSGVNPYEIRFPDIYDAAFAKQVYGPGVSVNGRLTFGFPYPPLSLLLSSLGYLIGGDCRYANLAAICVATVLVAYARPSRLSFIAALLLLFVPRVFYVITMSWTEPVVIFLLSAVVFCLCRFPVAAPWVTGLLLAGKQYLMLVAPLLLGKWQEASKAALIAVLVTAPLALWNVAEFWQSVVLLQFRQPLRFDALTYMAQLAEYGIRLPGWLPFLLAAAVIAFALWKGTVTPSAKCHAIGFVLLVFFAFNKQAFSNYYFLVIGVLVCAVATAGNESIKKPT